MGGTQVKITVAKAIVQVMKEEGVDKAFCVPGESFLTVIDELYDERDFELISGRQEGGVSFMAEGYAKATGKVGVCFATRGPGATNLSSGIHTAHHDSTPLVAFIGQVESYFLQRDAFQEIDMVSYFSEIVKWSVELKDPFRVYELVRRAFHIAKSGRPGPVLVSLPENVLDELVDQEETNNSTVYTSPRPTEESVKEVYHTLKNAKKPIVLAGGGIRTDKSVSLLVALSNKLGLPVATATRRMDAFPNEHPHYIGTLWSGAADHLNNSFQEADVVLVVGSRLSQATTNNYSLINKDSILIHVDISEQEINKVYQADIGIVADAEQFLTDLGSLIKLEEGDPANSNYAKQLGVSYKTDAKAKKIYNDKFVDLEGLVHDLMEVLPSDAIIASDAGNYLGWLLKYYKFRERGTCIAPTSGAMGYGLPAAIGAKIAYPKRKVISFSGDGGFMMTIQELETAVRYNIPVIAIVANNNMYGTIRAHQESRFPRRQIATELSNPNFSEMMKLMQGHGEYVTNNKQFIPALKRAIKSNKPSVIEVIYDSNQLTVDKTVEQIQNN